MMRLRLMFVVGITGILASTVHAGPSSKLPESSLSRTPPRQNPNYPVTQPEYPASAASTGQEGTIILGFYVKADGTVDPDSIVVQESTGVATLDQKAMQEATRWRFLPATENGKPVGSDHQFRVVFELRHPSAGGGRSLPDGNHTGQVSGGGESDDFSIPLNIETGGMGRF